MSPLAYIGDGVYARHDGFQILLEAEADGQLNRIALEPETCQRLAEWSREFYAAHGRTSPLQLPEEPRP